MADYQDLKSGSPCPKCELGKGLRDITPIEIGLTGLENYVFLHCDICGANFVGKNGMWNYLSYQAPRRLDV